MHALRFRPALLLASALAAAPLTLTFSQPAQAQLGISINIDVAPPELPVYEQPPLPGPGYLWQPGYWAYGEYGYYWVPGTWVEPPQPGLLWTPGYWGFEGGAYRWNAGYWGPHVGFYGGIDYGFGYNGLGFFGGEWRGNQFFYNRAVIRNFGDVHVTNVYERNVVVNRTTINHVSFNGGNGVQVRPTAEQLAFAHEQHIPPTAMQMQHLQEAGRNRALYAAENHGHPAIAATPKPNEFTGPHVVAARDATMRPAEAAHAGAPTPDMAKQNGRPNAAGADNSGPANRTGEPGRPGNAVHGPEAMGPHEAQRPETSGPGAANGSAEATRPGTEAHPDQNARPALRSRPEGSSPAQSRDHATPGAPHVAPRAPHETSEPSSAGSQAEHPPMTRPEAPAPRAVARPEGSMAPHMQPMQRPAAPQMERPAAPTPHPQAVPHPAGQPHAGAPEHKPQH